MTQRYMAKLIFWFCNVCWFRDNMCKTGHFNLTFWQAVAPLEIVFSVIFIKVSPAKSTLTIKFSSTKQSKVSKHTLIMFTKMLNLKIHTSYRRKNLLITGKQSRNYSSIQLPLDYFCFALTWFNLTLSATSGVQL